MQNPEDPQVSIDDFKGVSGSTGQNDQNQSYDSARPYLPHQPGSSTPDGRFGDPQAGLRQSWTVPSHSPAISATGYSAAANRRRGARQSQPRHLSSGGVIALVLGVIGIVLNFIPGVNDLAVIPGAIGVVFGVIGLVGVFRGKKRGKGLTIFGAILSILAVVLALGPQFATNKVLESLSKGDLTALSPAASPKSEDQAKPEDGKSGKTMPSAEGDLESAHVKIESAERAGNDSDGAPTVLVTYQWTNKTDKGAAFSIILDADAFQNGQELQKAIYRSGPLRYSTKTQLADVKPGAQGVVAVGYILKDDSPVTVEVSDRFAFDDETKVSQVYNL